MQLSSEVGQEVITPLNTKVKNVREWFDHFDNVARSKAWFEEVKARKVTEYFKGDSRDIYKAMSNMDKRSYRKIRSTLIKQLTPEDAVYLAKRDFMETAQRADECVSEFGRRIRKKAKAAEITDNKEIISHFMRGLMKQIAVQIATEKPRKLDRAIELAKRVETCIEKMDQRIGESINSVSERKVDIKSVTSKD